MKNFKKRKISQPSICFYQFSTNLGFNINKIPSTDTWADRELNSASVEHNHDWKFDISKEQI